MKTDKEHEYNLVWDGKEYVFDSLEEAEQEACKRKMGMIIRHEKGHIIARFYEERKVKHEEINKISKAKSES